MSMLPDWVGSFASGRGDLAERHEEILRDEGDEPEDSEPQEDSGSVDG